jgi:hypothetical protein
MGFFLKMVYCNHFGVYILMFEVGDEPVTWIINYNSTSGSP